MLDFYVKPTRKFIYKRKLYKIWCKCRLKQGVIFNQSKSKYTLPAVFRLQTKS